MIDKEADIFDAVYPYVAPLCAKNRFVSKRLTGGAAFPAASLIEMDNAVVRRKQTSTPGENFARITYELEAYAMTKAECRKVKNAADEILVKLNFSRISGHFIDNPDNVNLFRYVARYEAMVDEDGQIYRTP